MRGDRRGQLLLVTGIVLTTTLLLLAIYSVNLSNLTQEEAQEQAHSLKEEYSMVKTEFGRTVQAKAQHLYDQREETLKSSAIVRAIKEVSKAYQDVEANHGLSFSAHRTKAVVGTNDQTAWSITVRLVLADETASISEEVSYGLTLW